MSLGIHRLWKQALIDDIGLLKPKLYFKDNQLIQKDKVKILDVAAGTGDISFKIIENYKDKYENPNLLHKNLEITLLDVNQDILNQAELKAD